MVACFSVVVPWLTILAYLSCSVIIRVFAYRYLRVCQRMYPHGAETIGVWHQIFSFTCTLAVLINSGIVVFQFQPLRDLDLKWKLFGFIVVEHVLVSLKEFATVAMPAVPEAVERAELTHLDVARQLFSHKARHIELDPKTLPVQKPMNAWVDAEEWDEDAADFEPFHLRGTTKGGTTKGAKK